MRIVLKPAGALLVVGSIAALVVFIVVRNEQSRPPETPEMGPIAGFQSKKKKVGDVNAIFDSKDKMVPINLTEAGSRDWIVWGVEKQSGPVRKADGGAVIGDYELLIPDKAPLGAGKRGPTRGLRWTGGKPVAQSDITYAGVHVGEGNGFRFKVPATNEEQTLRVFVGGLRTPGDFSAFVTDGSKPAVKHTDLALSEGYYSRMYEVTFKATTPKQVLTVVWKEGGQGGNVSLQAAALE
jgi:hypothetical protein